MQTSYQQDLSVALAGMIADGDVADITSYAASEAIPYGRVVVVDTGGTCSLPKTAGAMPTSGVGSPLGVSIYDSAGNPGGFQIGDMVPVLRRGKVWAEFSGTAASDNTVLNVSNSSTVATNRGKFTDAATSTTAGSEVSAMPRTVAKQLSGTTLVRVDINIP
jgi:hypothetical protein